MVGAVTVMDPAIVEYVCEGLANGDPLEAICRNPANPVDLPSPTALRGWALRNQEIAQAFTRAREVGYESIVDRCLLTSRGFGPDEGGYSSGDVKRDRLIIQTSLDVLARLSPRYSPSLRHTNAAGDGNIQIELRTVLVDELQSLLDVTPVRALEGPAKG